MTLSYDHIAGSADALPAMESTGGVSAPLADQATHHTLAADVDTASLISSERGPLPHPMLARAQDGANQRTLGSGAGGPKPLPLFSKGKGDKHAVNMNDIRQGNYSDCFFLASIAAVVQNSPKNIENMITPHKRGSDQGFLVRFHGGTSTFVTQADIAAEIKSGRGAALGDGGECWVKVLEIALRRLSNAMPSFTTDSDGKPNNDVNGGLASEALPLLTGREAANVGPGSFNGAHMHEQLRTGAVITAASNGALASTELSEKYGIAIQKDPETGKKNFWHEYTVTKVEQGADGEYQVSLFNPWGQGKSPRPIPMTDFKKIFARLTVG